MEKWTEELFSMLEKSLEDYVRPVDYKERMDKLLNKVRKPIQHQFEGLTNRKTDNE